MRRLCVAAAVLVLLTLVPRVARATVNTVTITFTGSGTVGATPFNDAANTFTVLMDTNNRQQDGSTYFINSSSASVAIEGFGSGDFTFDTRIFVTGGAAGFSRAGVTGQDILDIFSPSFDGWDLTGPIGPVFEANPYRGPTENLGTTLGNVTYTSFRDATFTATPEPTSAAAVWVLAALTGMCRRRPRI